MSADKAKIPRKTLLDDIEELVSWYEHNKPDAGQVVHVNVGPKQLAKALGRGFPVDKDGKPVEVREWPAAFRGRTLVATGDDRR